MQSLILYVSLINTQDYTKGLGRNNDNRFLWKLRLQYYFSGQLKNKGSPSKKAVEEVGIKEKERKYFEKTQLKIGINNNQNRRS